MTKPNRRQFQTQALSLAASLGLAAGVPNQAAAELSADAATATGSDIGTLFPQIKALADSQSYPMSALETSYDSPSAYRETVQKKILELFHYEPEPAPFNAETVMQWETDDYIGEKILFNTTPLFRVPAYVLTPKKFSGKRPAIVDLHCHAGVFAFGKEKVMPVPNPHPALEKMKEEVYEGTSTSEELVKRGYVVISIDRFYFGERRTLFDDTNSHGEDLSRYSVDEILQANRRAGRGEATLAKSLFWAGTTWNGIAHWDDKRSIDYLITRDEVDHSRIGCMGISMGGDRTNYLSAIDDRIQCAVSVGWMAALKPLIHAHVDTHSFSHFLPGLTSHMDLPDVLGSLTPKPLLVQYCSQDGLYTMDSMKESEEKLQKIYDWAEASKNFAGKFYETTHRFTREMQNDAFAWFDEHL